MTRETILAISETRLLLIYTESLLKHVVGASNVDLDFIRRINASIQTMKEKMDSVHSACYAELKTQEAAIKAFDTRYKEILREQS